MTVISVQRMMSPVTSLGGPSDNEEEDDTDDEMEDDDAEIERVAATAASMKDVFLFPNSTITLSVADNILSKFMRYVEDRSTLQPFQATTSASLVKHHVISYIRSSYRRSSPWIMSAGINTV